VLVDTGPLVALLDTDDPYHAACLEAAARLPAGPLQTTWPCFTEAMYLLGAVGGYRYQERLWTLRSAGRLELLDLTISETERMAVLMAQYRNVPMDLADASLVAVADCRSFRQVFALDSDFYIYRLPSGAVLEILR